MNKINGLLKDKTIIALFVITLLGFVLRVYRLSELPVSLYWDEVSIGYNAYSIGQTLNDEYGKSLPLLFRAYDDYKLPGYIYLDSLFVKMLGLDAWSVRLPSAIAGVLTVIFVFFMTRKLFFNSRLKDRINPTFIALISAFLLSISPWHIQFSRGGFEANLALLFIVAGVFLFLKLNEGIKYLIFSFILFAAAFYTYRSVYLFLPFLMAGLIFFWRKQIVKIGLIKSISVLVLFLFLIAPIVYSTFTVGSGRISQTSISNEVNDLANKHYQEGKPKDRRLIYAQVFLKNYTAELSPGFLFLTGDPNGRHSTRGMGVMYLWELPFLILGIFVLLFKFSRKVKGLILLWIITFPISVALTIPSPHALRGLNGLPALEITVAAGICYFLTLLPKNLKKAVVFSLSIIILVFLVGYGVLYKESAIKTASDWGDGYRQLYQYVVPLENSFDKIIVSGHFWQPYEYALFYKKYDPLLFQKNGSKEGFGKYYFGGTGWDTDAGRPELDDVNLRGLFPNKKVIVALSKDEFERQKENIKFKTYIKDSNDNIVFIIGDLK